MKCISYDVIICFLPWPPGILLFLFFQIYLFYFMCMGVLSKCRYVHHVQCLVSRGQMRVSDQLWVDVSLHVSAGNGIQACMYGLCSYPLSNPSSPSSALFMKPFGRQQFLPAVNRSSLRQVGGIQC